MEKKVENILLAPFVVVSVILTTCFLGSGIAHAATIKATPRVSIKYNYNDNLYAEDVNQVDETAIGQYINYLVGLSFTYKERRHSITMEGDAGYEHFIAGGGSLEDRDIDPNEFSALTLKANVLYRYLSKHLTFELFDRATRTRDLGEVFGSGTDALGYWSLYTNNVAGVNLRLKPSGKSSLLIRYAYDTLVFEEPEDDITQKPADSTEHRGFARAEYEFSPRITGLVDGQYAVRAFEDFDEVDRQQNNADYNLLQAMAGARYKFSSKAYVQGLGGGYNKAYTDLPEEGAGPQLEDATGSVVKLDFIYSESQQYKVTVGAIQGVNTYGQNLMFEYTSGRMALTYYITPKVTANVSGLYKYVLYDVEKNDREDRWKDDRKDNLINARANIGWDILQKGGEGTLSVAGGYTYQMRDSNIDGPEDYVSGTPFSYDTLINIIYFRVQMLPSILIGK